MRGKATHVFASKDDLVKVINAALSVRKLSLYEAWISLTHVPPKLVRAEDLIHKQHSMYMILDEQTPIYTEQFTLKKSGETRYSVGQSMNPNSIMLYTGGFISDSKLLPGDINTIGSGSDAVEIYKLFAKIVRKKFEKIDQYYVGPEAATFLDSGGRLAQTEKSSTTSDLVRKPRPANALR